MNEIYFVDEQHKLNFEMTCRRWPQALSDTEYQTACYILAVPMIFHKMERRIKGFEKPVDWIWNYLEWSNEYKEEWRDYGKYRDDDRDHPDFEAWLDRRQYDLSGSMVYLGKFSLNLWNSSNESNLMNCLGSLDDKNFKVLLCAIDMRMGKYKLRRY